MSQAEEWDGEIAPLWWCRIAGRGGERWYFNGPFRSEVEAAAFGSSSGRRFDVRKDWVRAYEAPAGLARPRLWSDHPVVMATRRGLSLES